MIKNTGHPYSDLPGPKFWRSGVVEPGAFGLEDIHQGRISIGQQDKIACLGSCFAQHIGQALRQRGYTWFVTEPPPPMMSATTARRFGYNLFSARTGNIFTPGQLEQWIKLAFGGRRPDLEAWEAEDGRWFDPIRPTIEPDGFGSRLEMEAARENTISAVRKLFTEADLFVFTLGQTEYWQNSETGLVYALCPGTAAGAFDAKRHKFKNTSFFDALESLEAVTSTIKAVNPDLKILFTVSPVPLTATASPDHHALVANMQSKATLRAVAAELAARHDYVDYFPSFELIFSPSSRGVFYKPNMRQVEPAGVRYVMEHFSRRMAALVPANTPHRHGFQACPPPMRSRNRCAVR